MNYKEFPWVKTERKRKQGYFLKGDIRNDYIFYYRYLEF